MVDVTQADRDLASGFMPCNTMAECERVMDVKLGKSDTDYRVQTFANHRAQAEADTIDQVVAWLRAPKQQSVPIMDPPWTAAYNAALAHAAHALETGDWRNG